MAKHKIKWAVTCHRVNTCIVSKTQSTKVVFPLKWPLLHCFGQHIEQSAVKSLYKSVQLGMVRSCLGFYHTKHLADFRNYFRFEVSALIGMKLMRGSKAKEELVHQLPLHHNSFLIGDGICLSPPRKLVSDKQNIGVACPQFWEWPDYVHGYHL